MWLQTSISPGPAQRPPLYPNPFYQPLVAEFRDIWSPVSHPALIPPVEHMHRTVIVIQNGGYNHLDSFQENAKQYS